MLTIALLMLVLILTVTLIDEIIEYIRERKLKREQLH